MKISKALRVLSMYERLSQGVEIKNRAEAERFGVDEKTIRRDIQDLRAYLAEFHGENWPNIEYDKQRKGYVLCHDAHTWLTNEEVLVIIKILLESRAFTKEELNNLLDKLILQSAPEERKHIKDVVLNERYHYAPVSHGQPLIQKLWDLSLAVRKHKLVKITYRKVKEPNLKNRVVEPLGIIFSEYYFYLIAYIHGYGYDFPAVYRLDRIVDYSILKETFSISEVNRFEEGEFRKRVQFMWPGHILRIQFRFWGESLEAVLDRLPTARVLRMEGDTAVVEAEVFGRGIKMWLLSQAQYLEVIGPPDFRREMYETINEMMKVYK